MSERRPRQPTWGVIAALLAFGVTPGSQVRPINLEQMIERAATIFAGHCTGVRTEHDARVGQRVTVATFDVDQAVKGVLGPRLTVRMLTPDGGSARDGGLASLPEFRPGEEVVLFLYGESAGGLTSPVGLGQGRFSVLEDKHGRKIAVRGFREDGLLDGFSERSRGRLGATLRRWQGEKELEAPALLDMTRLLAQRP